MHERNPLRGLGIRHGGAGALVLGLLGLAGCGQRNEFKPPPPPEVVISTPVQQQVTNYLEFTGTTQASERVDIRSRVTGYLDSIHFRDGNEVSRGELLFKIDPRPFEAKLGQAQAEMESKKAAAIRAEAIYKRTQSLLSKGASTKEDVDKDKGDWGVAREAVHEAEKKVIEAELNLKYTQITAPISGRIGRRQADVGSLINADQTVLTTIARYDPMYVYFNVSEKDHLDYMKRRRQHAEGTTRFEAMPRRDMAVACTGLPTLGFTGVVDVLCLLSVTHPTYPIEMKLANQDTYEHKGYLDFADLGIDPATGTLLLRGVFQGKEAEDLSPGLFVRVRLPIKTGGKALLVPERALSADQQGRYLLVLSKEDIVERRGVKVGMLVDGDQRVIDSGIKLGERFIVEGLQRARPGSKATPVALKASR